MFFSDPAMKAPSLFYPAFFAFYALLSIGTLSARTWTSTAGHSEEGKLVKFDGKNVTVLLTDRTEASFPFDMLSQPDQEFLKKNHPPEIPKKAPTTETNPFNWDDPWPAAAFVKDTEITVEKEDEENSKFIYTSNNFRFICDVRLTGSVVRTFAKMFEASHEYCRIVPLALTGGIKTNGKYDVRLFETKASYVAAGGPPASAGVFIRRGNQSWIMVPLISLGVQKFGSGYRRDRDKDDSTLVHEIVHQLTPNSYFEQGSRGWFSEGLAEYISNTPYRNGRFRISNNFDAITEYFSAYGKEGTGGRNLGKEFRAPALRDYMTMPYGKFTANANFNYGFGLCLTTYFLHLEGEGDGALIKTFLAKFHEKGRIRSKKDLQEVLDILLNGRTWEELQDDVSKKWKRKGIKITFGPSRSSN